MIEAHEVKLPSGATLKVRLASFADGKALYQAAMREMKGVDYNAKVDVQAFVKDLFASGLSSPAMEAALKACMKQATIDYGNGDEKITDAVFEPAEARGDYIKVVMEVGKHNLFPFLSGLYAYFVEVLNLIIGQDQKSTSPTTSSSPT